MTITLEELVAIGDRLVQSIESTRLENDAVLRNAVEDYHRIKSAAERPATADLSTIKAVSESIRAIEARLDIVSPD